MSDMADAHARDSAAERELRELARQIDAFLATDTAGRLSARGGGILRDAVDVLRGRADQIVAVWD